MLSRRRFVQGSLTGSLTALAGARVPRLARPSDALRVAVVGLNGRGAEHVQALRALSDVRVVALCDVDDQVLAREARKFRERDEHVGTHTDFRNVLERKDVDAVALATPNHWHALQTIWACQAGKDVYVEKPVSHTFAEGQLMVAAAQKYGRIVQSGLQSRSSTAIKGALEWVAAGNLGRVELVRALCYKPRPSIGKTRGNQRIPDSVDYDLWCGPAPLEPLRRTQLHYDWHWFYATGDGDLGNQGVHQMDVALWALGSDEPPKSVISLGARLGYDDDGETPNTQIVFYAYDPVPIVFEVRGLPRDAAAQAGDWGVGMDDFLGVRIGVVVHCAGGTLRVPSYTGAVACGLDGNELQRWEGAGDHFASWVAALKSRRVEELTAGIEIGTRSSALCHMGNVSQRLGSALDQDAARKAVESSAVLSAAFGRLGTHLEANGVDLSRKALRFGPCLELDPSATRFQSNERANALLQGRYREPFVLPAV